jgi:hypothetical protein
LAHNTEKGKKRLANKIEPFTFISELNPMPDIVKRGEVPETLDELLLLSDED